MTAEIVRFESAAELRSVAEPFLMRQEAQHNLLIGLIGNLERTPGLYGEARPYLAAAVEGADVAGVALMTPPRNLVISVCESTEVPELFVRDVLAFRPPPPGVNGPVESSRRFAEAWMALTGESARVQVSERCYKLEAVSPTRPVSGASRRAREADLALLTDWWLAFTNEAVPHAMSPREDVERYVRQRLGVPPERGGILIWEDEGKPVSMAGCGSPHATACESVLCIRLWKPPKGLCGRLHRGSEPFDPGGRTGIRDVVYGPSESDNEPHVPGDRLPAGLRRGGLRLRELMTQRGRWLNTGLFAQGKGSWAR